MATATTEDTYQRLPDHYRHADSQQDPAEPLLRYLSLVGDQLHDVAVLAERFAHREADGSWGSDLADPDTADAAWLDWLARFVGLDTIETALPADKRTAITDRIAHFDDGSLRSLIAALTPLVADIDQVVIEKHANGDPWLVEIHMLDIATRTWADIETDFPTWADIEATGNWATLVGAVIVIGPEVQAVRPAGVRFYEVLDG